MRATRWVLVAYCLGLAGSSAAVPREEIPPIVERSIAYHGGPAYESSEVEMTLCSGSGCYKLSVWRRDGLYRHRVAGPVASGRREVEVTNRSVVRFTSEGAVEVSDPAEAQRLRDWATARVYFVFLPYRLQDPSVLYRDLGKERWGERVLHKVKITFRARSSSDAEDEYLFWFAPGTARLEQFAYSYQGSPGGLRFRRLGNYRRIGGILFFDQENLGIEGEGLTVDRITPEFVDRQLRRVSTVELDEIEVRRLGASDESEETRAPQSFRFSSVRKSRACGPSHWRSSE